jgi:hypothetical protein
VNAENELRLCAGFRPKHSAKARANELDADQPLAIGLRLADMHYPATGLKIIVFAAHWGALQRYANLQIRANGYVEASSKRGTASAQIFTGCLFFEAEPARIFSGYAQRQPYRNPTFGPLPD